MASNTKTQELIKQYYHFPVYFMELNPKIAEMAKLINEDRAALKTQTDASMKEATDAVNAKTKSECELLGIPFIEHPVDTQIQYASEPEVKIVTPELKQLLKDLNADHEAELSVKPLFPI